MATSSGSISTNAGAFNVNDLVNKLMEAETKTKTESLVKKAEGINAAISAYGSLKAALSSYETALKGLNPASFSSLKASVANNGTGDKLTTDAVSAEINQDEQTKKLAQKLQSAGFEKNHVFAGGSVMAIKLGSNPPTFITLKADATLAGLRDTINASKAGVSASIVSDASGERLVLESNTAGTGHAMRITGAGGLSTLTYDSAGGAASGMTQIQAPRDDTKAAAGSYAVSVLQLAQAHKLNSSGIAPGTTFENGVLAIKTGNGSTALIKPSSNTLAGVRDAINASDAGVSASIINDGTKDRLVISAKESGAANVIRITGTGDYAVFAFDPDAPESTSGTASDRSMGQEIKPQDAKVTIDGITVTSTTNSFKNVLSGVQLTVSKVTAAGDKLVLNITSDPSGMTTAANTFVTAYNTLLKAVADLTKFTPGKKSGEKGSSSPLASESAVRNMMLQLRSALTAPVEGQAGLSHLAAIGIALQKNGTLALDNTRFTEAVTKNFDAVSHLLGSKQGIVPKIQKIMEQLLATDGILEKKKEGLEASLRLTEGRKEEATRRLSVLRDHLTNKYNRLNVALSQAEQRGSYLLKQLALMEKK
jgi:flagellar hook-associated protein 2